MAWMRQIRMNTIIGAASVNETEAVYPTSMDGFHKIGERPMEKILSEADMHSMSVYLSLQWWSDTSDSFLDSLNTRSETIASELCSLYSSHESLKGIYITREVDNLDGVQGPVRHRLVDRLLKPGSDRIDLLDGNLAFCEASFCNPTCPQPAEFQQVAGIFLDDSPWETRLSEWSRIEDQILTLSNYVEKIVIFCSSHYLRSLFFEQSRDLYRSYRVWSRNG